MTTKTPTPPAWSNVYIAQATHAKLKAWIEACPVEVSGLGLAVPYKTKSGELKGLFIKEIFILEQTCSAGHTELDETAVVRLMLALDEKADGLAGQLLFWWHSHAKMGVFWSGTDTANITRLLESSQKYLISYVGNHKGEYRLRVDIKIPQLNMVMTEDELYLCEVAHDFDFSKEAEADIKKYVTETHTTVGEFGNSFTSPYTRPYHSPYAGPHQSSPHTRYPGSTQYNLQNYPTTNNQKPTETKSLPKKENTKGGKKKNTVDSDNVSTINGIPYPVVERIYRRLKAQSLSAPVTITDIEEEYDKELESEDDLNRLEVVGKKSITIPVWGASGMTEESVAC